MGETKVRDRGVIPRYVRMWIVESFGQDGLEKVVSKLSPEAGRMLEEPVPHGWYPVDLMREAYSAVYSELAERDPEVLYSLGRFIAVQSVRGFLQYLVRLISTEKIVARLDAIWKRYHEGGKAEAEIVASKGSAKNGTFAVSDYDAGEGFCLMLTGFIEEFIRLAGARDITIEKQSCIHKGGEKCLWSINWNE
jgi:predicted hydrocarbon binding protein